MHLSQRSRSERLRIEFRERLRYTNAEFRRDNCVNLFKRKRFDFVLQARQRIEVRLGQKIAARRKELAQLNECRPQVFQIGSEFFRLGLLADEGEAFPSDCRRAEPRFPDQIGSAVFDQQSDDVLVSLELLCFEDW